MPRLRKLVFYLFALIYLILCPLIVAHMLGFAVNPLTQRLVRTGLIFIATNPPDAAVYVDGRLSRSKTPAVLRDLTPGSHFIRIELNGYTDWERYIPVEANKATVANALLIPQEWPIKVIAVKTYANIFRAGQDTLIAANPLLADTDVISMGQETGPAPLLVANSIYAQGRLTHLYYEPSSPFILLQAALKDKTKFLWVNLNGKPPVIEDISDLFPEVPSSVEWDNTDNNIFAIYPTRIYRINIHDKAIYPGEVLPGTIRTRVKNNPDKFLINDGHDWIIRQEGRIRLYPRENFGGPRMYDIAQSDPSANMYFSPKTGELFYLNNDGRLCAVQLLAYHPLLNIPVPDALKADIRTNP
ncbi:MAG: PEGA domain-containing protein [Candidatus Omnitrophica bacterium]|nr:PEGA domain-containing protein [Candidatus Omnitrophota bacterium]